MDNFDVFGNRSGCSRFLWALILGVGLCVVIASFMGCKTTMPVVAQEVHNNYTGHDGSNTHKERDSIFIKETVVVREKGDTVYRDSIHIEYKWKLKHDSIEVRDSIYIHDSIPYPVEVPKYIPRERSGYDRFCSWFFWIILGIVFLWGAWKVCNHIPALKPYVFMIKAFFRL